jgi:purine nucleoside permease
MKPVLLAAAALLGLVPLARAAEAPFPVRVVVVTTFELGNDIGDKPGEFQRWVEKLPLNEVVPFPAGYHELRLNRELGVLGIVTGEGPTRAAASITALGHDGRFDLSHSYILLAGIAGIDPRFGSPGAAVWAPHVVDGDLAHEIDAREIPADWPTGYFPRGTQGPNDSTTVPDRSAGEIFALNPRLVDWAYALTRDTPLTDSAAIAAERALFVDHPAGQQPPRVMIGDTLSAMTFWHGAMLTDWANRWVGYWTQGQGDFVTSAMEDSGIAQAMALMGPTGRVDPARMLVLRAGSNYTMPPPGTDAASYLLRENEGYAGLEASVENLYAVGSRVVGEWVANWDRHRAGPP